VAWCICFLTFDFAFDITFQIAFQITFQTTFEIAFEIAFFNIRFGIAIPVRYFSMLTTSSNYSKHSRTPDISTASYAVGHSHGTLSTKYQDTSVGITGTKRKTSMESVTSKKGSKGSKGSKSSRSKKGNKEEGHEEHEEEEEGDEKEEGVSEEKYGRCGFNQLS
jgi:hypothetical protein